jgi:hypothetical protein
VTRGDYFAATTVLLSRRDYVIVARCEVPGNCAPVYPSRRVRYDRCHLGHSSIEKDQSGKQLVHLIQTSGIEAPSRRTLRDGSAVARFPGTSCQATIIQSLRDKGLNIPS